MDKIKKIYEKCLELIEEQQAELNEAIDRFEEYDDVDDMHRIEELREGLSCYEAMKSWIEEYM